MQLLSTVTCPSCGDQSAETIPTDTCQCLYECTGFGTLLKPKEGDFRSETGQTPAEFAERARGRSARQA